MKVYCYTEGEVKQALAGVQPQWYECPKTLERTTSPAEADCFFIPLQVGILEIRHPQRINGVMPTLARLPHWSRYEAKHFFFMHSDEDAPVRTTAIVFRWSVNKSNKDPRTITMPAPVEDLGYMAGADYEQLPFHVCFVGYEDDPRGIRHRCIQSLNNCPQLNCYLSPTDEHFGAYEDTPKGETRRKQFLDAMNQSRLILAPRGHGQHSYRPIEAASAGRIPVVVADDWQLPFHEIVNWDLFAEFVPESKAAMIHEEILSINERCRPDCMAARGRNARLAWELFFNPGQWDKIVLQYLKRML